MTNLMRRAAVVCAGAKVAAVLVGVPEVADAAPWHDNCTKFNHRYPHGVGRVHAHDHTSGTPVTNFRRSNRLYRIAIRNNSDLDRDRDHIACEKA